MADDGSLPYLMDPSLQVRLSGNWTSGGLLRLDLNGKTANSRLGPVKWVIVAALIEASHAAEGKPEEHAFVNAGDLADLVRHYLGEDITSRVYSILGELRTHVNRSLKPFRLTDCPAGKLPAGHRLIETLSPLGYRMSLPVTNLHVEFLRRDDANTVWDLARKLAQ